MSPGIETEADSPRSEALWCDIYHKWDVCDRIFDISFDMFHTLDLHN